MPMDIPEWRNVDRHLFETQILPAGRPAVFKGAVDNWPLVQRRTDSPAEIIDYLKSFNPATQVEWIAGDPQINGRFFYNDAMNGMNFRHVRGTFGDALTLLCRTPRLHPARCTDQPGRCPQSRPRALSALRAGRRRGSTR